MNRFVVWLIYICLWWREDRREDAVLQRAARRYWARVDWLIKLGLGTTALFFCLIVVLAFDDTCGLFTCENRFAAFLDAPANEVGDTLAGLAGGLAFLWLVVTVLLQGKELAAQRQELQLTRLEVSGQREATQDMAKAMAAQAAIFEKEQKQRQEMEAKELLEKLLSRTARRISGLSDASLFWSWEEKENIDENYCSYRLVTWGESEGEQISEFCASLNAIWVRLVLDQTDKNIQERPYKYVECGDLVQVFNDIERLYPKLSEAEKIRAEDLGLFDAPRNWRELLARKVLWESAQ